MWRYVPLLPVDAPAGDRTLHCGWTPLYDCPNLAAEYGVGRLYVKDDSRNPTASLKDRASAVAVAMAIKLGRPAVACASTGNAASSLSGFCAVGGLKSYIFVPQAAPAAKVTQLLIYGAFVVLVKGDYRDAFNLSTEAIGKYGWYNRNCAINPYLVEGKKTCGMEIAEQLRWDVPDYVFIAVGDGCCLSSLYKAFLDLKGVGLINRVPELVGVQAEGCRPIHRAVQSRATRVEFGTADTIADSIAVGAPRNWAKALRAIRETGGDTVVVSDGEILEAMRHLARRSGVFGEPAGVTGFAGFQKMARQGRLNSGDRVVVVVTGSGLKDIESARKAVEGPLVIGPNLSELAGKIPAE
jgi:threonine synthase